MFDEELKKAQEEQAIREQINKYKASFIDFAHNHNERRKSHDTGGVKSRDNSTD